MVLSQSVGDLWLILEIYQIYVQPVHKIYHKNRWLPEQFSSLLQVAACLAGSYLVCFRFWSRYSLAKALR